MEDNPLVKNNPPPPQKSKNNSAVNSTPLELDCHAIMHDGFISVTSQQLQIISASQQHFGVTSTSSKMSEQGFGCMGFSAFYSSARKTTGASAKEVFRTAVESGVNLFNTATFYGPLNKDGYGANLRLLKECLVGLDRSKVQLMVKIGMDTRAPVEETGELHFSSYSESPH